MEALAHNKTGNRKAVKPSRKPPTNNPADTFLRGRLLLL